MAKNQLQIFSILIVLIAIFNTIFFVVPLTHNNTYWILYSFTMLAFVIQFFILKFSFLNEETLKSKFLHLPMLSVGSIYLILQLLACCFILASDNVESWVAIVTCVIILGFTLISLFSGNLGIQEVERIENKVKEKIDFITSLKESVEILISQEENTELQLALSKLLEQIKYSNPVSSKKTFDIERQINDKISQLSNSTNKAEIIKELESLLSERNIKCKYLK